MNLLSNTYSLQRLRGKLGCGQVRRIPMHYMCGFVGCLTERRSKILVQEVYFSFLIMMCCLSWCINTILFPCILRLDLMTWCNVTVNAKKNIITHKNARRSQIFSSNVGVCHVLRGKKVFHISQSVTLFLLFGHTQRYTYLPKNTFLPRSRINTTFKGCHP